MQPAKIPQILWNGKFVIKWTVLNSHSVGLKERREMLFLMALAASEEEALWPSLKIILWNHVLLWHMSYIFVSSVFKVFFFSCLENKQVKNEVADGNPGSGKMMLVGGKCWWLNRLHISGPRCFSLTRRCGDAFEDCAASKTRNRISAVLEQTTCTPLLEKIQSQQKMFKAYLPFKQYLEGWL